MSPEAACKPSSVVSRCTHRAHGRPSISATYPGAERAACCGRSRLALPYSVLLRLELAAFHSGSAEPIRHRHCGAGPHLTVDGCYPLACSVELGLSSDATFRPMRPRPSGRLQGLPEYTNSNTRSESQHSPFPRPPRPAAADRSQVCRRTGSAGYAHAINRLVRRPRGCIRGLQALRMPIYRRGVAQRPASGVNRPIYRRALMRRALTPGDVRVCGPAYSSRASPSRRRSARPSMATLLSRSASLFSSRGTWPTV